MNQRKACLGRSGLFGCLRLAFVMAIISFALEAAASNANWVCVLQNLEGGCTRYQLLVTVSPSGNDIGRPGAIGIGLRFDNGRIYAYNQDGVAGLDSYPVQDGNAMQAMGPYIPARGSWKEYRGHGLSSVAMYYEALPGSATFAVFEGTPQTMCQLMNYQSGELWVGWGSLSDEAQERISYWHAQKNPRIQVQSLAATYIQIDATRTRDKSQVLQQINCGSEG